MSQRLKSRWTRFRLSLGSLRKGGSCRQPSGKRKHIYRVRYIITLISPLFTNGSYVRIPTARWQSTKLMQFQPDARESNATSRVLSIYSKNLQQVSPQLVTGCALSYRLCDFCAPAQCVAHPGSHPGMSPYGRLTWPATFASGAATRLKSGATFSVAIGTTTETCA